MKELSTREVQKVSLGILKHITSLCDKLGLKYVLMWGTLIGAVRHQGFIPWDDDIDIAMPRKDYEILFQHFQEHDHSPYAILSSHHTDGYQYLVPRVVDTNTIIRLNYQSVQKRLEHGVFVDIYPFDRCGEQYQEAATFFNRQMSLEMFRTMALSASFVRAKTSLLRTVVKYPLFLYAKTRGPVYYLNRLEENARKSNAKPGHYYCCWCGTGGMDAQKLVFDRDIFDAPVACRFEDAQFMIPKDYDYVLKQVYGNYMELPPEKDRVGHHYYSAYQL